MESYSQYLLIFLEKNFDNIHQKVYNFSLTQKSSKNSSARKKERKKQRETDGQSDTGTEKSLERCVQKSKYFCK